MPTNCGIKYNTKPYKDVIQLTSKAGNKFQTIGVLTEKKQYYENASSMDKLDDDENDEINDLFPHKKI